MNNSNKQKSHVRFFCNDDHNKKFIGEFLKEFGYDELAVDCDFNSDAYVLHETNYDIIHELENYSLKDNNTYFVEYFNPHTNFLNKTITIKNGEIIDKVSYEATVLKPVLTEPSSAQKHENYEKRGGVLGRRRAKFDKKNQNDSDNKQDFKKKHKKNNYEKVNNYQRSNYKHEDVRENPFPVIKEDDHTPKDISTIKVVFKKKKGSLRP